jgi:ABC-type transport system substrate-binding protein
LLNHYRSDGIWNFGGIDDLWLDDLIDELSVTTDEADRHDLLGEIQQVVVGDEAYGWFLGFKRTPVIAGPAAQDYPLPVANLWLSPYG